MNLYNVYFKNRFQLYLETLIGVVNFQWIKFYVLSSSSTYALIFDSNFSPVQSLSIKITISSICSFIRTYLIYIIMQSDIVALPFTKTYHNLEINCVVTKRCHDVLEKNSLDIYISNWSTRPTTVPALVITIFTQSVRQSVRTSVLPSVRPYIRSKTSKSSDNHCRPGLWAGRVDHWWLLSCIFLISFLTTEKILCPKAFPVSCLNALKCLYRVKILK